MPESDIDAINDIPKLADLKAKDAGNVKARILGPNIAQASLSLT